ncbi:hypothetical protein GGX14DRAFT_700776 [Mycena pura]|uniref:Uncharacterized protein n=1 Tax=Mycena pura TaxID=153505 RepID=A0AAD6UUF1_9AGAR|nr:hypothetical protein GGX14DRAFT_700776 [Mycena pura]
MASSPSSPSLPRQLAPRRRFGRQRTAGAGPSFHSRFDWMLALVCKAFLFVSSPVKPVSVFFRSRPVPTPPALTSSTPLALSTAYHWAAHPGIPGSRRLTFSLSSTDAGAQRFGRCTQDRIRVGYGDSVFLRVRANARVASTVSISPIQPPRHRPPPPCTRLYREHTSQQLLLPVSFLPPIYRVAEETTPRDTFAPRPQICPWADKGRHRDGLSFLSSPFLAPHPPRSPDPASTPYASHILAMPRISLSSTFPPIKLYTRWRHPRCQRLSPRLALAVEGAVRGRKAARLQSAASQPPLSLTAFEDLPRMSSSR